MKKIGILMLVFVLSIALVGCEDIPEELTCDTGYEVIDNQCQEIIEECTDGFSLVDGECIEDIVCEDGTELQENVCVSLCTDEEEWLDGECTPLITDLDLVNEAIDALALPFSVVVEDVDLPGISIHDGLITWESSNEGVLSSEGVVNRPVYDDGDAVVTLTASITIGEEVATKEFEITITRLDEVNTDDVDIITAKDNLSLGDVSAVTENLSLPKKGDFSASISWTSSNERIISTKGYVNRPGFTEEDIVVTLTATITLGEYTETKVFDVTVVKEEEVVVTSVVTLPFESIAEEYIVASGSLDVYYMNNNQLPYVDIQEFITLLDGAIIDEEILVVGNGDMLEVSYTYYAESVDEEDYTWLMTYDFAENTMTVNDFDFFGGLSEETQTDFGQGLDTVDYVSSDPQEVFVDYDDYNFDIIVHEGKYLIPFAFANLYYSGGMYDVYYNGDKIWGVDTYQVMDDPEVYDQIEESSYNTKTMDDRMKHATYDFLAYAFNYFFGLKDFRDVDDYYDEISKYYSRIVTRSDTAQYSALFDFAYGIDDLHTWHLFQGYYESGIGKELTSIDQVGPNTREYYEESWYGAGTACDSKADYWTLDDGKIGVIFIEGFEAETPDEFGASLDALMALGTVESIVVDLSCNGGGILGAAFQILGYMTEDPIGIHSIDATDQSTDSWYMSSENDAVETVDWYVLTSPLTFSAANLFASVAKDMGIAKIIGQQSSGGACSLTAIILPDGSGLMISSTGMLTDKNYQSIEGGIRVNIAMADVKDMNELVEKINQQQ